MDDFLNDDPATAHLERRLGETSGLMKPFPDGLVYRPQGKSFTLEEPGARWISWLRKDRLVATDRRWPRWESSGEHARKFPEQVIPPGFE